MALGKSHESTQGPEEDDEPLTRQSRQQTVKSGDPKTKTPKIGGISLVRGEGLEPSTADVFGPAARTHLYPRLCAFHNWKFYSYNNKLSTYTETVDRVFPDILRLINCHNEFIF